MMKFLRGKRGSPSSENSSDMSPADGILMMGHLKKQRQWVSGWSERYFVLTRTALHYFKKDANDELFGERKGVITMSHVTVSDKKDSKTDVVITEARSGKTRVLRAKTSQEMKKWKRALKRVVKDLHSKNKSRSKRSISILGAEESQFTVAIDSPGLLKPRLIEANADWGDEITLGVIPRASQVVITCTKSKWTIRIPFSDMQAHPKDGGSPYQLKAEGSRVTAGSAHIKWNQRTRSGVTKYLNANALLECVVPFIFALLAMQYLHNDWDHADYNRMVFYWVGIAFALTSALRGWKRNSAEVAPVWTMTLVSLDRDDTHNHSPELEGKEGNIEGLPSLSLDGKDRQECWGRWNTADFEGLKVRGKNYLSDKKKIPAGDYLYDLIHVDLLHSSELINHVLDRPKSWMNTHLPPRTSDSPLLFVINWLIPGPRNWNLILYFMKKPETASPPSLERKTSVDSNTSDGDFDSDVSPASSGSSNSNSSSSSSSSSSNSSISNSSSNASKATGVRARLKQMIMRKSPKPKAWRSRSKSSSSLDSSLSSNSSQSVPPTPTNRDNNADHSLFPGGADGQDQWAHSDGENNYPSRSQSGGSIHDGNETSRRGADLLMQRFLDGDDEFRDSCVKLIPRVIKGHWFVKKACGTTPAIIGKKIKSRYFRNEAKNYMEVDIDISSSSVARKIMGVVYGYCPTLTIDLNFLLEGHSDDELPERLLGGVRFIEGDLDKTRAFNDVR